MKVILAMLVLFFMGFFWGFVTCSFTCPDDGYDLGFYCRYEVPDIVRVDIRRVR